MPESQLERRVAKLERVVASLKTSRSKDWRRTIGMFTGDADMQRLFEEAMKLREADRAKARRKPSRTRRRKA